MKRSTYIYLALFLAISTVAVILMSGNRNSTIARDVQDFAVQDTAAISRLELSDRNNHSVVLERKGPGNWIVNNAFKAQQTLIEMLLETINRVQVKNPVPLSARDNVIKTLAAEAVRIRIFKNSTPVKTYFVGGTTPDELGTLMLLENAREPFVTYIPGFEGYLNSRYITNEKEWRSTEIYHLNPSTISSVTINYPQNPEASFKLTGANGLYTISAPTVGTGIKMSEIEAKRYLSGFRGINFEEFVEMNSKSFDSLIHTTPMAVVNLVSEGRPAPQLKIYRRSQNERSKEINTVESSDQERYFGIINDEHEAVLLQSFVISKILASKEQLSPKH